MNDLGFYKVMKYASQLQIHTESNTEISTLSYSLSQQVFCDFYVWMMNQTPTAESLSYVWLVVVLLYCTYATF